MRATVKFKGNKSIVKIEVLDSEIPRHELEEFVKGLTGDSKTDVEYE